MVSCISIPQCRPCTDQHALRAFAPQTALFNFQSLLLVVILLICTSAYLHEMLPSLLDKRKDTVPMSIFWKCARVGERLSPYVSLCCVVMAVRPLYTREGGLGTPFWPPTSPYLFTRGTWLVMACLPALLQR